MAVIMFPNDGQRPSRPRASISNTGIIGFNSGASKLFDLNKYNGCVLYFDTDEHKIIVVFSNDESDPATVTLRSKVSGAEITSKRFFSYFNILPTDRILCDVVSGEHEGSLILDLKNAVSRGKRSQKDVKKGNNSDDDLN